MFKLFFFLPLTVLACVLGGIFVLPLIGIGATFFALALAVAIVVGVFRLLAAVMIGVSGVLFGALGLFCLAMCAAAVLAVGAAVLHLALPLLVIFGIVWVVRRLARPLPPVLGHT